MEHIGNVLAITTFPVKGMQGIRKETCLVGAEGLEQDRIYAFYDGQKRLNAGEIPGLLEFQVRTAGQNVLAVGPEGSRYLLHLPSDVAKLEEKVTDMYGSPVRLRSDGRAHDQAPVSLLTTATLDAIAQEHGSSLDPLRFRMNLFVDSALREQDLLGRRMLTGGAELRVVPCKKKGKEYAGVRRCKVITHAPDGSAQDVKVMATVAREFGNQAGSYASVGLPGYVGIGNPVFLE